MALEVTLPVWLGSLGLDMYNRSEVGRTTPAAIPAKDNYDRLLLAAGNRAKAIAPESSPLLVANKEYVPQKGEKLDTNKAASVARGQMKDGREVHRIQINPNADASYYAHELGHAVSQKNKIGAFVNKARHTLQSNPKLGNALAMVLPGATAFTGAALQEGDDDLVSSLAIAAAMASPTLIDEALASKNALAIMDDAGMKATAGQRGRLAGAFLSYLAPVLIAGSVGNAAGNWADDYTALYDL